MLLSTPTSQYINKSTLSSKTKQLPHLYNPTPASRIPKYSPNMSPTTTDNPPCTCTRAFDDTEEEAEIQVLEWLKQGISASNIAVMVCADDFGDFCQYPAIVAYLAKGKRVDAKTLVGHCRWRFEHWKDLGVWRKGDLVAFLDRGDVGV